MVIVSVYQGVVRETFLHNLLQDVPVLHIPGGILILASMATAMLEGRTAVQVWKEERNNSTCDT